MSHFVKRKKVDFAGNPPVRTTTVRAKGRDGLSPGWAQVSESTYGGRGGGGVEIAAFQVLLRFLKILAEKLVFSAIL